MPNDAITYFTLILDRGPLRRLGGASVARQGDSRLLRRGALTPAD